MFDNLMAFRRLLAATIFIFAALMAATTARAQQIVVIVNGEPITALDIAHVQQFAMLLRDVAALRQQGHLLL